MAEKKITAVVKLQLPAGKATAAPPVGSSLGPYGINIPSFTKDFNEKTAAKEGLIIPVVVTIYADRSFTFVLKTPPAAVLIKKACKIESGSANSIKTKVAKILKKIFLYTTIAVGVALLLVVAYQIFQVLFTLAILVIAWIFPKRWR